MSKQTTNSKSSFTKRTSKDKKLSSDGGPILSQFRANAKISVCNKDTISSVPFINVSKLYKGCGVSLIPSIQNGELHISIQVSYGKKHFKDVSKYPLEEAMRDELGWKDTSKGAQQGTDEKDEESNEEESKESH
jgi:hypothetical protein